MPDLADLQRRADALTREEKEGLIAYLVSSLPDAPLGPDDAEVARREAELDSGEVEALTHEQFVKEVGRE